MEYLAIIATRNRLTHLSQSIGGFATASLQNTGNPTRFEDDDEECAEFSARSAMLTWNSMNVKRIEGMDVNY